MAGSKPLSGASVQLYAAGATGPASSATALLTTALTTNASGDFSIPAGYGCPVAASQLYLVARGGQIGTGSANSAIVLLTPIGECDHIVTATQYSINEVTTTASAWALNQFLTAGANIASSATNTLGLINAIATAASLANLTTGAAPGPGFSATATSAANPTPPAARINTIANLLNTCTASTTGSACSQLFSTTTVTGSIPANTLDAALNIIRSPGNHVGQIYTLASASSAFSPALAAAPSDWTLYINLTGGGMNEPTALGVDSTGAVWVANNPGEPAGVFNGVASKFSPVGVPVFANGITGSGLYESVGLAIDAQNNVWIANEQSPGSVNSGLGSITVLNSAGQALSGTTGYTAGGVDFPAAIAIDTNTNVWVADDDKAHVTLLSSNGQSLSGTTGYVNPGGTGGAPGLGFAISVAIDSSHNAWFGNQNDGTVTKVTPAGQMTSYSCCDSLPALAFDSSGDLWIANYYDDNVIKISSSGTILSTTPVPTGSHPQGVAIDGSGTAWSINYRSPGLFQLAGSAATSPGINLSPATGWAPDAAFVEAYSIAIDASGNLWVSNFGSNILTEVVGLAAPVKTPLIGPPQTP
jgi:streptogramin lyase